HARTPRLVADLAVGLQHFLAFADEVGAIDNDARDTLTERCWAALMQAGTEQAAHGQAAEPCGHFLRLIAGALASGRAHVAGATADEPENAAAWGWQTASGGGFEAQGRRIGWVDTQGLWLE